MDFGSCGFILSGTGAMRSEWYRFWSFAHFLPAGISGYNEIRRDIMKTILYILEQRTDDTDQVIRYLEMDECEVIVKGSAAEGLEFVKSRETGSLIVLIDSPSKTAGAKELIDYITYQNDFLFMTPVLLVTDRTQADEDVKYLGGAASDVLMKPVFRSIMINRIRNAEKFFESVTFADFARILKVLPSNIYLKDSQCRYVFSSHTWHHIETGDDPDWTIRGKTDPEVRKDKENAMLAYESDRRIIETGKGTSYIIEVNVDGIQEYLQLIKEPILNDNGTVKGIIALINDVTEQEQLRRKLKERSITDTLTGCFNRFSFQETVLAGFSASQCPVTILTGDCDGLKRINDTFGHLAGDEWIRAGANLLKKTLPEGAMLFRTGGDEFTAIIPNMNADGAEALIRAIRENEQKLCLLSQPYRISLGYAVLEQPDDDVMVCIRRSDENMYQDKEAHRGEMPGRKG